MAISLHSAWRSFLLRASAALVAAWMLFGIYAMELRDSYEAELYGAALAGALLAVGVNALIYRKTATWRSRTLSGLIGGTLAFLYRRSTGFRISVPSTVEHHLSAAPWELRSFG